MPLRCLYVDLDGTLLGSDGSLFRDGAGDVSLLGCRAIEACHRADVEVVIYSGRSRVSTWHASRMLGSEAYIYESGAGMVIRGEEDPALLGDWAPREGRTTHQLIEESGAARMLLHRYRDRLEYHAPWHEGREVSHLFRGRVDTAEADLLLARQGLDSLRLVDNGAVYPTSVMPRMEDPRAYHLVPKTASKANAVARHRQARGYARDECIGVGDSREDVATAAVVGTFWLVANAMAVDPEIRAVAAEQGNVRITEAGHGPGVYEAVMTTLAEQR